MTDKINPIRPTDDDARTLARDLLAQARFAALATLTPDSSAPMVTRVAFALTPKGQPMTLISDLSSHTRALRDAPQCSLLVGEPGDKGDPLTHPRITLQATARFVRHGTPEHPALRDHYLAWQPKAQLYIDFADFSFALFDVSEAHLNGGFGKAFHLSADDLRPTPD